MHTMHNPKEEAYINAINKLAERVWALENKLAAMTKSFKDNDLLHRVIKLEQKDTK